MTLDTSEMVAQWRAAIARGGHRAYSIPVVEMVALLDALDEERGRCADYRAACQAIQEGKAAGDKRWRQRWNNLRRHTREQDAMLGRIRTERDAERERVRVLTRIGARIVESEVSRRPGLRSLAIEELRAALATAGGEGATGALWAE